MPPISFLRAKPKENAAAGSVKFWLHNHFGGTEPARLPVRVHASELTKPEGLCPRYIALYDLTGQKPAPRRLSTSERLTFQMGRDQERSTVEAFAEMGKAVCDWKCLVCSHMHAFRKRPERCEECDTANAFVPVEVRFTSALSSASCGVDMMLDGMGQPKLKPVELKTMASEEFKKLEAPLAEHRLRTTFYLSILANSVEPYAKEVDCEEATILYIAKNAFGVMDDTLKGMGINERFSPFKEFKVQRNDALVEKYHARASVVKAFREGNAGVPAGVCPTAMAKRAYSCDYRAACFSGDYPATQMWTGCA